MEHFFKLPSLFERAMASRWKIVGSVLVLGLSLFGVQPLCAQEHPIDVAVVVQPDTPVSNLSLADVRKIFLGDRQYWTANTPVVLLIRAPVARERDVVLKVIYQMSESQFKQYWIAKIFRAEAATAPKVVYSNDMEYELVSGIPGAIAFMDARNVRPGLKVLRVDGHLPGDKEYPLR